MNIRTIGIAGAGTMGYSMADIFAAHGYEVTLWNHRKEKLDKVKPLISEGSREKIRYTAELTDIADCDLIVESITENFNLKAGFYDDLSKVVQGCFTKSNSVFRVYSDDKEIARSVFLLRKH